MILQGIPRINATLDDCQENHQSSMVEIEGRILQTPISILIDPGSSLSYISPIVIEK